MAIEQEPGQPEPREGAMVRVLAVAAVGAAAVSLVAGLGTYLCIQFTKNRRPPQVGRDSGPSEEPRR